MRFGCQESLHECYNLSEDMKLRSRSIIVTLVVLATLFWIIPRTAKRASIQEHSNKFKLAFIIVLVRSLEGVRMGGSELL